jgi:hypothetical protein
MKIKKMTLALLAVAATPSFAADLAKSLAAGSEAEFLASAGPGWIAVGESRYETIDADGKRIAVGFGDAARDEDVAALAALIASLEAKLLAADTDAARAKLRNSIGEARSSMRAIGEGKSVHSKYATSTYQSLAGCNASIGIQATFEYYPAMISSGGVTVEAFGPSFFWGGEIGTVTLTAIANDLVDSASKMMVQTYVGDYLSADSAFYDWGCTLQALASIVPACPTSGYRSVQWTTTCESVYQGTPPTPVLGN